jgi:hypothetical protein
VTSPQTSVKRKFFFAYAREDSEFVLRLANDLRQAGVSVWLDQLDVIPGQRWDHAVEEALQRCDGLLAVLSPDSVASQNVMDEVSYALEEGKLMVPLLLRPTSMPFRLRRVQYLDFTPGYDRGLVQLLKALDNAQRGRPITDERAIVDMPNVAADLEPPAAARNAPHAAPRSPNAYVAALPQTMRPRKAHILAGAGIGLLIGSVVGVVIATGSGETDALWWIPLCGTFAGVLAGKKPLRWAAVAVFACAGLGTAFANSAGAAFDEMIWILTGTGMIAGAVVGLTIERLRKSPRA